MGKKDEKIQVNDSPANKIIVLVKTINKALMFVSVVFLLASTFLATINAILRKVFLSGFAWAEELSTFLIIMMVFAGIGYLELTDNHLCIGVLNAILKKEWQKRVFYIFRGLLTLFLSSVVFYYSIFVLENMYRYNMITYGLRVPRYYFFLIMPIGFLVSIISWLAIICLKKGGKVENVD